MQIHPLSYVSQCPVDCERKCRFMTIIIISTNYVVINDVLSIARRHTSIDVECCYVSNSHIAHFINRSHQLLYYSKVNYKGCIFVLFVYVTVFCNPKYISHFIVLIDFNYYYRCRWNWVRDDLVFSLYTI